jgi:hypothetical protein
MSILSALGKGLGGIGRFVQNTAAPALFPVDPTLAAGIDPQQIAQMRKGAMLRAGLGMLDGQSFSEGLGQASQPMERAMMVAYENSQRKQSESKADSRYDSERSHRLEREKLEDSRAERTQSRLEAADAAANERFRLEQKQQDEARKQTEKLQRDQMAMQERLSKLKVEASETPKLRPVPAPIARAIVENRQNLSKIDRALEAVKLNPQAFGAANYLGDAVTQRLNGKRGQEGVDERAAVADIGSLIIHDRSGAAVSAAEFPRLKPFIPTATDTPATVKKKLEGLRAALAPMIDDLEGTYTPETGYMGVGGAGLGQTAAPPAGGLGQPAIPSMLQRPQTGAGVEQRAQGYY